MKPIAKKTLWAARDGSGLLYAYNEKPKMIVETKTTYDPNAEMPKIGSYTYWVGNKTYKLPEEWLPEQTPATEPVKISLELWMEEDNSDERQRNYPQTPALQRQKDLLFRLELRRRTIVAQYTMAVA